MYQVEDIARNTIENGTDEYFARKYGWVEWAVMKAGHKLRYNVGEAK